MPSMRARSAPPGIGARLRRWIVVAIVLTACASSASAQYFGRNKVRYRSFDFQVLKTQHFDIYFYPEERAGVDIAARLAERWYGRLDRLFGRGLGDRQPLVLYASHADFEQTNVVPDQIDEGTGGFTEPFQRRIVLPLAGPIADTDHVIGHELVHAFQFELMRQRPHHVGDVSLVRLPLWFIEGMAEYISLGPVDANTAMRLRDAARRDHLPTIRGLDSPEIFPYQWGHAAWAYIGGRYGDAVLVSLLNEAIATGSVEVAIQKVLDVTADQLSDDWHASIHAAYDETLAAIGHGDDATRLLVTGHGLGSDLNVGPVVSPDGRWVAFLSGRGVFSIDLYLADERTGRMVRRLTSTATDGHYSSLQFISSAGAWDATSTHLAIAAVVAGRPALAIFNTRTGRREREIAIPAVDDILTPAWSPDGRTIAFTGMRQGLTDLFLYELDTGALRALTSDPYADLHPSWSPDGRRLVFVSDRFSSDLESLRMGDLRLVVVDVDTGALEAVPAFTTGKHINPQWSADGDALYFIADPDGLPNIYRRSWSTGAIDALVGTATGVAGITPSSPALSVASVPRRIAFSVFEDDEYRVYVRDSTNAAPSLFRPDRAATLPPPDRTDGDVARMLAQPERDLLPAQAYPTEAYTPKLSLAGIGQPSAGVSTSRFGTSAGGGASLYFSDFLGDHLLATAVQVSTPPAGSFSAKDVAFDVTYVNQARRWNWGMFGSQQPYLAGTYEGIADTLPDGRLVATERATIYRETQRSVGGLVAFPFDRLRRVEFHGGISQTSFDRIVDSVTYLPSTGQILDQSTRTDDVARPLNLGTAGVALVFDNASFGATSPVQGRRARLEVSSAIGSIGFTGVTVDYRRYLMPVPFYTVALRVLHYGRYGDGADDERLFPVYVNNPSLVRGFDSVYYASACVQTGGGICRVSDPFAGSRLLVANVELRFPLLRPFGAKAGMYGPVPVEVAVFGDTGVAWTARDAPAFASGTRPALRSAGVALRASLGIAVAEFDVTRPLTEPNDGWTFGINLLPGW